MKNEILFYKLTDVSKIIYNSPLKVDDNFRVDLFVPGLFKILPSNCIKFSFFIWWLFWLLRILKGKYFIGLIYKDNKVIQHFLLLPKFFKYPFMDLGDYQIGDVWTDPTYRGHNLSPYSISVIVKNHLKLEKSIWYLTTTDNKASISVTKKLGIPFFNLGFVNKESYFYFFKTNIYKL